MFLLLIVSIQQKRFMTLDDDQRISIWNPWAMSCSVDSTVSESCFVMSVLCWISDACSGLCRGAAQVRNIKCEFQHLEKALTWRQRFGKERDLLRLLFLSKVPSFIVKLQRSYAIAAAGSLMEWRQCWRKKAAGIEPQGVSGCRIYIIIW